MSSSCGPEIKCRTRGYALSHASPFAEFFSQKERSVVTLRWLPSNVVEMQICANMSLW